jgi:hypothetical protein
MSSDDPRRMTRERAVAFLDVFAVGLAEERASISEQFGVKFNDDGTLEVEDDDLAEPGSLDGLTERLAPLTDALKAEQIFYRRYVQL